MSCNGHVIGFEAEVLRFEGPGGWHGVFLPAEAAAAARFLGRANALGAIAVTVEIGDTTGRTSLFPDKRRDSYLLPLNAKLRRAADIAAGSRIAVTVRLID